MEHDFADVLNREGFFFQKYCAQKVKEAGWTVDFEEYPISENETFDIKANLVSFGTALSIAVIECKRQDPARKYWAFYRKDVDSSEPTPFSIQTHSLVSWFRRFPYKSKVMRMVIEGLNESELEFPVCHTVGVEVYKTEREVWKANSAVIRKACLTVSKGVNHLFDSEAERLVNVTSMGLNRLIDNKKRFGVHYFLGGEIIPVVITSAPILSIKFNPVEMNVENFRVLPENLDFVEMKWLVYEFPLPSALRYSFRDIFTLTGENRYAKMHILIVNGKSIMQFFENLAKSIRTRSEKSWRTLRTEFMEYYKPKKAHKR